MDYIYKTNIVPFAVAFTHILLTMYSHWKITVDVQVF